MSKGLVSRATSDDVKPVTGLQLKNLADATIDIKECDIIREALLSRLEESSPFVKFKVLRIVKYICQHGKSDFRMELQRGEGNKLIKDCLAYKGTPHETRGDAPNQAVREEAKAALAAIFGSGDAPAMSRENIVGFGSAGGGAEPAYGGGGGGNGGSGAAPGGGGGAGGYSAGTYGGNVSINVSKSGNMIGFGNPAFENRPESKGIFDTIKDAVVGTANDAPPFKPWQQPGPYAGAGYGPGQYPPSSTPNYTPTAINHATQPTSAAAPAGGRKKGQVGGAWDAETAAPVNSSRPAYSDPYGNGGGGGGSFRAAAAAPDVPPARTHTGGGEFERKLVEEIVQPSGVRSFPTPQEMSAFVKKCQSLDSYDIASLLDAKLAATVQAASQLKALAVLDALLGSESADGVSEFYRAHASDALLLSHENAASAAMRKAAAAVLQKTGLRAAAAATATGPTPQERQLMAAAAEHQAASSQSHSSQAATPNLLFEVPSTAASNGSTAAAPSDASVSSAANLFGELTVNPSRAPPPQAAPTQPTANNDLGLFFPPPQQQQTAPQPVPKPTPAVPTTSPDMFSALLQMSNKPAVNSNANSAAANTNTDPFSALYKKPAPTQPANTNNNPYAALAGFGTGSGGSGSSNANSNLNFLSNSNKNYNFTVTAARGTEQPAAAAAAANNNNNRSASSAIDPFANAFAGPVPKSSPAGGGGGGGGAPASGFGFIAADKSADPFGGLVQLK